MATSPSWSRSPATTVSTGTPEARTARPSAPAHPDRTPRRASASAGGARIRPTGMDRSTSGTPEHRVIVRSVRTSASRRRTPSAASDGTAVRAPTVASVGRPTSTSTETLAVRTRWQLPVPTSKVITSMESLGTVAANGRAGPHHRAAPSARVTTMATVRVRRSTAAIHAAPEARAAIVHHGDGRPVHQTAPGRSSDATAIASSVAAHAAATCPSARPSGGTASTVTAAATPAIVVSAAAGIVATLSGAAHPLAVPACAMAIGVLTTHAVTDAAAAVAKMPVATRSASGGSRAPGSMAHIAWIARSARDCHRSAMRGESTRRPTTTP